MARRWNESNHPRHDDGRFKDKLGGGFAKRLSDQIGAQRGEPEPDTKGVHRYSIEIRDGDAPTARMMQNRIANRLAGQSNYLKDSRATFVGVERSGRKGNYKYDVKITGSGTALPPEELQRWTGGAAKRLDAERVERGDGDGSGGGGLPDGDSEGRRRFRAASPERKARDDYNAAILEKAYNAQEAAQNSDEDFFEGDDDLNHLVEQLDNLMAGPYGADQDREDSLADQLREHMVRAGWADEGELPDPPGGAGGKDFDREYKKPGFAQRISDQIGRQRGETPSGGPRPGDRDKKLFTAAVTGDGEALDGASVEELKRLLDNPDLTPREQITVRSALARKGATPSVAVAASDGPSSPLKPAVARVIANADAAKLGRQSTMTLKQALSSPDVPESKKAIIRRIVGDA